MADHKRLRSSNHEMNEDSDKLMMEETAEEKQKPMISSSGRSLRKRASSSSCGVVLQSSQKKTKTSASSKTNGAMDADNTMEKARHLITSWICAECKEAECVTHPDSPLLVCEGPCLRLFHYPCARLSELPLSEQPWICDDCTQKRHKCSICHEYGTDDVEVYKCEKKTCGLFYHEQCLSMYDSVTVARIDPSPERLDGGLILNSEEQKSLDGEDMVIQGGMLKFKCPAHSCWTCSGGVPVDEHDVQVTHKHENGGNNATEIMDLGAKKSAPSKAKNTNSISACFQEKFGDLIRCMECPNAFHITCITPSCRFHELALLCHEHARTCKLPYLDHSTSVQSIVEAQVDGMYTAGGNKTKYLQVDISRSNERANRFLPGLRGDIVTSDQSRLELLLSGSDTIESSRFFPSYYFPVEIRNEVHSKLPSFIQIQSNRYDPNCKPKRHPATIEYCKCIESCDSQCLNRIAGIECVGNSNNKSDKTNPYRNCNIGPTCGNRLLTSRSVVKCKPVRETGKGWGLISVHGVPKGELVLEYVGEVIDEKTKRSRLDEWSEQHPNDPNYYIMSVETGWYIDARECGNLSRFINHSCDPNCHLSRFMVSGYSRIGIVAVKDVAPGEFLSYDYHFDTKDGSKFVCRCGAEKCRGTMKGGVNVMDGDDESRKRTRRALWFEAKSKFDKDKKFLEDLVVDEKSRLHLGKLFLPGEENNESAPLISAGPQPHKSGGSKVFLWRNAVRGSNFHSRYYRMIRMKKTKSYQGKGV